MKNTRFGYIIHYDDVILGVGHTFNSAWTDAVKTGNLDPNSDDFFIDTLTHCAVTAIRKTRPAFIEDTLTLHVGDPNNAADFGHYGLKRGCVR